MLVSGRTGVGKSTLLGVLTGLVPRFSGGTLTGDVLLDGASIIDTAAARARARRSGTSARTRSPASSPTPSRRSSPTAWSSSGSPPDTMRRRVEETLDLLGIADLRARDLRTLSGGEQQRVAIGAVLTTHPRLLVLDEPTSALDPTAAEDVLATLTRLVHDLGLTVLLAEHRLERVVPFADRIAPARPATAACVVGEPADRPGHLPGRAADHRAGPGGGLVAAAAERARGPAPRPRAARPAGAPPAVPATGGEILLDAHGLDRHPRPHVAVRDVDVDAARWPRHRPDGAQRVGQVDADLDAPGRRRAPLRLRRGRRRRPGPARRRPAAGAASGWCRRPPPTCSTSRRSPRSARPRTRRPTRGRHLPRPARPAGPGHRPPTTTRATSPRASASPWSLAIVLTARPAGAAARRADPRARLRRQARSSPRSCATWPTTATPCSSRPTTSSSWPRWPTTSSCSPRGRSCPPGRTRQVVAASPSFAPQVTKILGAPVAARRRGRGGAGGGAMSASPRRDRRRPRSRPRSAAGAGRRLGGRADDAVLAAAARVARGGARSTRRSSSSRCCRW